MERALWTGLQAREVDRRSIEDCGIAGEALMEEAGRAVFQKALSLWRPFQKILVLAGPGNNGGDALVAARLLYEAGFSPHIFSISEAKAQETPARHEQRLRCEGLGLRLEAYRGPSSFSQFSSRTLIIDGVLGLGVRGGLRPGVIAEALAAAQALSAERVLAIDLPSGLDPDRWDQAPPLPATHTLTFGGLKPAHVFSSSSGSGELMRVTIGFHPKAIESALAEGPELKGLLSSLYPLKAAWPERARALLQRSPWASLGPDAHKYTRGHVLVIGGSAGKGGAPLLAAEAALRSGAGWVSVAHLDQQLGPPLPAHFTYEALLSGSELSWEKLSAFLHERRVKALLIGPGTMKNPCSPAFLRNLSSFAKAAGLFLVFDAGALQDFGARAKGLSFDPEKTLVTPHPGEWRAIAAEHRPLDSMEALEQGWNFAERLGVTLCYKSSRPLTLSSLSGSRSLSVSAFGDQRLAKAGSGDLLAGVALAFGAAGLSAPLAAHLAQDLIAAAAARASEEVGFHGLGPEDCTAALGPCLDQLERLFDL